MAKLEKQTGEYLKGDFVKEREITELTIKTEPKDVESDYGTKAQCEVTYKGFEKGDPFKWTLNKKSRNMLIDYFGDDTETWNGKTVPIESALTEKGRAIYVDEPKLKKMQVDQVNAKQQTEIM